MKITILVSNTIYLPDCEETPNVMLSSTLTELLENTFRSIENTMIVKLSFPFNFLTH